MTAIHSILILATAFVAVFLQAACDGLRGWLGAQVDLLPALVVYAALRTHLTTLALLAIGGGLGFDTLSLNPLGVTILPLFLVGLALHARRDLILREQPFAQFVLGAAAGVLTPTLTVLLLLTAGHSPLLGWGSVWQLMVLGIAGGALTPLVFLFFDASARTLNYRRKTESSFRPDRDIRRGRT